VERALEAAQAVVYTPLERGQWYEALNGADAVVNLAGEQVVGRRHTKEKQAQDAGEPRRDHAPLVEAIAEANHGPRF
jgi:NAD dependent epimerase/dehydratase family enzyme